MESEQKQNINFASDEENEIPVYQDNVQQEEEVPSLVEKKTSIDGNKQYKRQHLMNLIFKKVNKIQELLALSEQWAFIYFNLCGWNQITCQRYIQENTARFRLSFKPEYQLNPTKYSFAKLPPAQCELCYEKKPILRNLCGCEFCIDCWNGHLSDKLSRYSQPSPVCINQYCPVRVSHLIVQEIAQQDNTFSNRYNKCLCRVYAKNSKDIKVCCTPDCSNCFYVKRPFELTQCNECHNYLCLICGEESHNPVDCFDVGVWKRLTDQSPNFMTNLGYNTCPKCKEGVDRFTGCNLVKCRCQCEFCYACGQNWAPHHSDHFRCYRQKEIQQLQKQNEIKKNNAKEYKLKMDASLQEVFRISRLLSKIKAIDRYKLKGDLVKSCKIYETDLAFLDKVLQFNYLGYLYMKYGQINDFLSHSILQKSKMNQILVQLTKIDKFFNQILPYLITFTMDPQSQKTKANKMYHQFKENHLKVFAKDKVQMLQSISRIEKLITKSD